jgi:hypothetical protein
MSNGPAPAGTRAKRALIAIGLAASACTEGTASSDGGGERVELSATLRDGQLVVSLESAQPLYHKRQCGGHRDQVVLEKGGGGDWTRLVDERPRSWPSNGYNLDGRFVRADIGEGCAMPCEDPGDELMLGPPVEYVVVSQTNPTELVTLPYRGELRIRFAYSLEPACMDVREAFTTLDIE